MTQVSSRPQLAGGWDQHLPEGTFGVTYPSLAVQMTPSATVRRCGGIIRDFIVLAETTICSLPASSCSNAITCTNARSQTSTQAKTLVSMSFPQPVLFIIGCTKLDWGSSTVFTSWRLGYANRQA